MKTNILTYKYLPVKKNALPIQIFALIIIFSSLNIQSQNKKENDSIIDTYGELNVLYDYNDIKTKSGHILFAELI